MKFLRNLLATLVGLFIFTFIMVFILILIASAGSDEKLVELKDNTIEILADDDMKLRAIQELLKQKRAENEAEKAHS